ncbi:uncharacterized protein LOC117910514, partial [Vitis riparia]|uniref:uncharacterized protein LOC117910514 n=1 Tax=Vitis riparia TaxID=96939 RepID=UPI00155AFE9F
ESPPVITPHDNKPDTAEVEKHPIAAIVIIIAMQTETLSLVNRLQLTEDLDSVFLRGVLWAWYRDSIWRGHYAWSCSYSEEDPPTLFRPLARVSAFNVYSSLDGPEYAFSISAASSYAGAFDSSINT